MERYDWDDSGMIEMGEGDYALYSEAKQLEDENKGLKERNNNLLYDRIERAKIIAEQQGILERGEKKIASLKSQLQTANERVAKLTEAVERTTLLPQFAKTYGEQFLNYLKSALSEGKS